MAQDKAALHWKQRVNTKGRFRKPKNRGKLGQTDANKDILACRKSKKRPGQ